MKPIKMLGLAALAALMAMAFVGVSSAMAELTGLCGEDAEPCKSVISHVHETTLEGKKALLKAGSNNVECDVLFLGDVESVGAPLVISGKFTYSNCNSGCTVAEENGPSEIEILRLGHENADVTGGVLVKVKCSFMDCSYSGEGLLGTAKGSLLSSETNGEVSITAQEITEEGESILCPGGEALLTIITTPLNAMQIVPWRMACMDVGAKNGVFLNGGNNGTTCGGMEQTEKIGRYELVFVSPNINRGEMGCAEVGAKNGVFLSAANTGIVCGGVEHGSKIGRYELGTTT